jgi:hypothetical protein
MHRKPPGSGHPSGEPGTSHLSRSTGQVCTRVVSDVVDDEGWSDRMRRPAGASIDASPERSGAGPTQPGARWSRRRGRFTGCVGPTPEWEPVTCSLREAGAADVPMGGDQVHGEQGAVTTLTGQAPTFANERGGMFSRTARIAGTSCVIASRRLLCARRTKTDTGSAPWFCWYSMPLSAARRTSKRTEAKTSSLPLFVLAYPSI